MRLTESPTRREILLRLKRSDGLTVDQLSEALGISPMGVRQHLAVLANEGIVGVGKRRGGLGRPAHVYSLTDKGHELFPRQYDVLALDVLETVRETYGEEAIATVFRRHMERLLDRYAERSRGKDLAERIEELAQLQCENGFMAEAERTADGYYMREYNCVIAHVAEKFPAVCSLENEMFSRLLGTPIQREACMAKGSQSCVYFIPVHHLAAGEREGGKGKLTGRAGRPTGRSSEYARR